VTDQASFVNLEDRVRELHSVVGSHVLIAIACNKCDLSSRRQVSVEQAQDFASSLGAMLFETSAKTNQGVEELFLDLSANLLQQHFEGNARFIHHCIFAFKAFLHLRLQRNLCIMQHGQLP
jgi:Ras-related protein Rab-21